MKCKKVFRCKKKKEEIFSCISFIKGTHYSKIKNGKYKLNIKDKNFYILSDTNGVYKIFNFGVDDKGEIFVVGKKFSNKRDFFSQPCKSSSLNIFKVKELSKKQKSNF